ncbi:hypothetical protein A2442_00930 [Candidatus Campbellbacteria bacterium RIFOXYC2_FULL_35_25]|uniref:DUF192 domain-containing protein n=1 Tax=Candidatus Campbellbacteria bacterium RIFOXYC2_FULL_35_25 TaxID=1797582 RepID=A0A1F5EJD5_9BACT|nr:MAG: hypothetical protein A2442_00930 [Candidatus Campbellbacteria bacterium RIFOXYC2_FULL_35_25]
MIKRKENKLKMKAKIIFIIALLIATSLLYLFGIFNKKDSNQFDTAVINNSSFRISIADTALERARGLSNKISLPKEEGLLFVFNEIGVYHFWMKDMNFPIDIIWIGEDYKIVYIKENALPESYPEKFNPNQPALYVLEINAGMVSENEIKIEDFVFLE